jgi:hypothetical protein
MPLDTRKLVVHLEEVPAGAPVDIPVCYRDAIWVRSHYDLACWLRRTAGP